MKWNKTDVLLVLIGWVPCLLGMAVYGELPERMATHFGPNNQVDGTMSRPAALAVLAVLGLVPLLIKAGRRMDPRRDNYAKFEGAYNVLRWAITLLLCLVGLFVIGYNLGYDLSPKWVASFGVGSLIIVIGNFMGQLRFNYTFGIRTPWTLSNESVWRRTHRMAGPLWIGAGFVMILSAFAPDNWGTAVILTSIFAASLIPAAYSYWLHRNLQ